MSVIYEPTEVEQRIAEAIRSEVRNRLDGESLSVEEAASRLGVAPVGLTSLLARKWTFEEAFRIASNLDINFAEVLSDEAA
ncbi:hypothetical protein LRS13_12615 [Svornostia abyssi]|uniref:HTH cro/C1-type domain-containing protein n=1 Tax=Svornostia abyssi TaxID=2898438 RepID=A0ABY5PAD6_9ACTN|nr:hypothetical protein LRS13_12615 [Parviterribacteraceae bacterium J379]